MKKFLLIQLFLSSLMLLQAVTVDNNEKYKPKLVGEVRARYEYDTNLDAQRFQVRNARLNLSGKFSEMTSYKTKIDLSNRGKISMLDAYVKLTPTKWFNVTIGQQKVPFGIANLRGPSSYYFANRSFVAKQLINNSRDVGIMAMFSNKKVFPVNLKFGVYNGDSISNQKVWKTELDYAVRLEALPIQNSKISVSYKSIRPQTLRMNVLDVAAYYEIANLHLEAEYIYKTYENQAFSETHAFATFASYDILTNKKHLKKITPLIRFDVMNDNNRGIVKSGAYQTDDACKRITGGVTLSLNKPFLNDLRFNYEHYMYDKGIANRDSKFVVEAVVKF